MPSDYYAVLGVAREAGAGEIRRRFRELARERHPDRFQGEEKARAEREFQALTEAFNVLYDPARRRLHDAELSQPGGRHDEGGLGLDPREVARACGFSELSPFYRAFRRWYGMPPEVYRARLNAV